MANTLNTPLTNQSASSQDTASCNLPPHKPENCPHSPAKPRRQLLIRRLSKTRREPLSGLDKRTDSIYHVGMSKEDTQPATKGDIAGLDAKIDDKIDGLSNEMVEWKDEILTSNDRVVKKLDRVITEQQAITVNYKRLDHKIERLEEFAEQAAKKLEMDFERV